MWSPTGTEIFFWSDGNMVSVQVESADDLEFTTPVTLFSRPGHRDEYHVTSDGRRFLQIVPDQPADLPSGLQIQVVLNWFEELKRLVPVR